MNYLDQPLGEIARLIPGATAVFHQHQLKFCCDGEQTLRAAATDAAKAAAILQDLEALAQTLEPSTTDLNAASNPELIEHLLSRYHDLHRQQLPELVRKASRVELVHGAHPHCPAGLTQLLETLQTDLEEHMRKEEQVLFPMIARGMGAAAAQPARIMREEHADHGVYLEQLEQVTGGFELPAAACGTWRSLYQDLRAFCRDLKDHIHLENNLLFSRLNSQLGG